MKNLEIFDTEKIIIKIVENFFLEDDHQLQLQKIEDIFYLHELSQKSKEELKTQLKCAICLESLIDIKKDKEKPCATFITGLCGHQFDYQCIASWKDNSCAICRYEQTPTEINYCNNCNKTEKLWVCFTCGYLGCGDDYPMFGHIYQHYQETNHAFCKALFDIDNQQAQLFDQSSGNFVRDVFFDNPSGHLFAKIQEQKKDEKKEIEQINQDEMQNLIQDFQNNFEQKVLQQVDFVNGYL